MNDWLEAGTLMLCKGWRLVRYCGVCGKALGRDDDTCPDHSDVKETWVQSPENDEPRRAVGGGR